MASAGTSRERCDSPVGEQCHDCGAPCDPDQAALARGDDAEEGRVRALEALARAEAGNELVWGPKVDGPAQHFVLLSFDRVRAASYLGHRDVIRVVAQAMRRAFVPLRYSEGFTPRPRLVFRSALPVGVIGFGEEVVAEVTRPLVDPAGLLARLASVCPDGISFTSARDLPPDRARRVGRGPSLIRWMLPVEASAGAGDALEDILAQRSIVRSRTSSSRQVQVDVRPLIETARLGSAGTIGDMADAGLDAGILVVLVDARPVEGRWIRPAELVSLLAERGVRAAWVARRILTAEEAP